MYFDDLFSRCSVHFSVCMNLILSLIAANVFCHIIIILHSIQPCRPTYSYPRTLYITAISISIAEYASLRAGYLVFSSERTEGKLSCVIHVLL
jgi:hypothetical protein